MDVTAEVSLKRRPYRDVTVKKNASRDTAETVAREMSLQRRQSQRTGEMGGI
jgi:hypothetical protein